MRLFMIAFQVNLVFFPLVYDTSSRETFEKLEEWLNEIEMYSTKKDIIKMKKKKMSLLPQFEPRDKMNILLTWWSIL